MLRLCVVAGKGGVGRSSVAAALAEQAVAAGKRVLAVDGVNDGGLQAAISRRYANHAIPEQLTTLRLSTEMALKQYLDLYVPLPGVSVGPIAKAFDFLAVAAPGVREILAMGKVCYEVRRGDFDLVILDSPATGHAVELLSSPDTLAELIPVGPLTSQTGWMREMLADATTGAVLVTLPEELPVEETLTLAARVRSETSVRIVGTVINRMPTSISDAARREAEQLRGPVGEAARLVIGQHDRAVEAVETLRGGDGLGVFVTLGESPDTTAELAVPLGVL